MELRRLNGRGLSLTLARYGKPESLNTDQGSQFTSADLAEIDIVMDGKGAWRDKVFIERLWRSIKYEEVYLHAYKTVSEARAGIGRYLTYNCRRPHSSLDQQTPDQAYFNTLTPRWRQHNRGGNPLSEKPQTVQINRTTSSWAPSRAQPFVQHRAHALRA
ncbi:putative transposase [Sinorhizobium meliloti]|uniref:Transposase protein n=1 Tax=Sinorhizobium meliloti (strain SM11) TaxID=707241 RepID=F7XC64_SINMM|nr:putative transposase protein [Sinorhizobium meliloti SM11]MBP2470848.1 putative transposase [Sinorhizobium meliloti]GEC42318.1 hypothetical protein EME01_63900 [Sinorhizobium meliloti]